MPLAAHRLNINEYRISLFLGNSDLFSSRNAFYDSYKDSIFNQKKISQLINSSYYNLSSVLDILTGDKKLINLMVSNPIIPQYF